MRSVDLHDEDVFDTPPGEDVSDSEADEPSKIVVVKQAIAVDIPPLPGIHMRSSFLLELAILRWIFDRLLSLPPNIEVFRLSVDGYPWNFSLKKQHKAIAALTHLYPCLHEVQFGWPSSNWKRSGKLWRLAGNKAPFFLATSALGPYKMATLLRPANALLVQELWVHIIDDVVDSDEDDR
ncbi:hypothetical protein FB451DRAFT_1387372 [Mycena latifolia]|nr:hypothetical protein FB451DRAFT_1387372 [Mycena latifolia]